MLVEPALQNNSPESFRGTALAALLCVLETGGNLVKSKFVLFLSKSVILGRQESQRWTGFRAQNTRQVAYSLWLSVPVFGSLSGLVAHWGYGFWALGEVFPFLLLPVLDLVGGISSYTGQGQIFLSRVFFPIGMFCLVALTFVCILPVRRVSFNGMQYCFFLFWEEAVRHYWRELVKLFHT